MFIIKQYWIFLTCLIISTIDIHSQENLIFNNNYLNPFVANPACTGVDYYPTVHLSTEKQLSGFADSPVIFLLTGNVRIGRFGFYNPDGFVNKGRLKLTDRTGLGAVLFKDINGPLSNAGAIVSYAYHIPVQIDTRLSLGLSLIFINCKIDNSILEPYQKNDYYLFSGDENYFTINAGFGIYYHSKKYFVGASIVKFLPDKHISNNNYKIVPEYFTAGGYKFKLSNSGLVIESSFLVKKSGNDDIVADFHTKIYGKKLSWIALSYCNFNQLHLQFGLRILKNLYIGYNYGYAIGDISRYNYGSHEVSLGLNLGLNNMIPL